MSETRGDWKAEGRDEMTTPTATPEALAAKIEAMSPPEQLRFAALLLEKRRASLALPIIRKIADELELLLMWSR